MFVYVCVKNEKLHVTCNFPCNRLYDNRLCSYTQCNAM